MLPSSFLRSLVIFLQVGQLVLPLLSKNRRQKLPLTLKEGALFVIVNWGLIWKFIEKQQWAVQAVKKILKYPK